MKKDLGLFNRKYILFQHASMGCDRTSRLFGIGRGTVLKKFKVQKAANVFDETPAKIESAGEKAIVVIYNGKMDDTLNSLRL